MYPNRILFVGCLAVLSTLAAVASEAQHRPVVLEEVAKILPPGPTDQLTGSVAISGDDFLAAWRRNFDTPEGFWAEQAAHMFRRRSDGTWQRLATLATMSSAHLGASTMAIAMKGDVAAVNADSLMIFERTAAGWQRTADLGAFGIIRLEIDGGTVVGLGERCSWHAFRKSSSGWERVAGAAQSTECGPSGFSQSVDVSGPTIAIANPNYGLPPGVEWSSRVRVYRNLSTTAEYITDPFATEVPNPYFSFPVAVDQATIYAGRFGQAVAFERAADGTWREQGMLEASDAFMLDSASEMQAAGLIVAGVTSDASRSSGSVRVYEREGPRSYREAARLYVKELSGDNQLGSRVQLEGRRVVAAALRGAYVFQLPENLNAPVPFQDTFGDGNANGWTPSTNTWRVVRAGEWMVYRQTDVNALEARSIRSGLLWGNQSVEALVTPTRFAGNDRWFGVITRYTDESNYYYLSVRNTNIVQLRRKRNGVFTTLDAAPMQVSLNRPYHVRIEAIGARIRGYVDGELLVEAVDSTMRTGRPGVITYGATAEFDTVVATPSPQTTLFADNFNGQYIHSRWEEVTGDWSHLIDIDPETSAIIGRYRQALSQGYARTLAGVSTHDQVVEADASRPSLSSGAWYGLMARYVSDGNYYCLCVQDNNRISIQRFVNGSAVVLDSANVAISPNTWRTLRFEVVGSYLRGYVDGRVVLQASDPTYSAGRYGLATFRTSAQFDNVRVTQP